MVGIWCDPAGSEVKCNQRRGEVAVAAAAAAVVVQVVVVVRW
jgi:hypothetical protein